jgi:aspartate ammonia-lyase
METDLVGSREVSAEALWGIHSLRARDNFSDTLGPVPHALIRALAQVKKACALANRDLGYLAPPEADAILAACDEVIEGRHSEQFIVGALQGGAGTSTNMNMNEVLANRAAVLLNAAPGSGRVSPADHVNLHQSTNDVYPTAVRVAAIAGVRRLSEDLAGLQGALQACERRFAGVVTVGSTERVDAVPITMGAQFASFAEAVARDRWRAFKCEERLRVVNLGGTAVGTGLAAPQRYIFLVIEKLREVTRLGLCRGENLMDATANADPLVEVSGCLKAAGANFVKIADDLRLLHMGGLIRLPAVQAGSSLMPGKVNPVIAEYAMQAGIRVMANDSVVAECASRGSLQICEFMPLLALSLLESLALLQAAAVRLTAHVGGIVAVEEECRRRVAASPALLTALVPVVGYERATELARTYRRQGGDWRAFIEAAVGADAVARVLTPEHLLALGYREEPNGPVSEEKASC